MISVEPLICVMIAVVDISVLDISIHVIWHGVYYYNSKGYEAHVDTKINII